MSVEPVFLKESEMNRLLDDTDFGEGFKGCRDRLVIEVFYATGEALHLKITWLIFAKDTLTWRSAIFNRILRVK